jgi:hypothetical protein
MHDDTEILRQRLTASLNARARERADLAAQYGEVWDADELRRDFEVLRFLAPFVHVRRHADGVEGLLMFQHHPRYYFAFEPAPVRS